MVKEKKTSLALVQESEARLRRAEIASKSGSWELHLERGEMFVSEGATKLYGLKDKKVDYEFVKSIKKAIDPYTG